MAKKSDFSSSGRAGRISAMTNAQVQAGIEKSREQLSQAASLDDADQARGELGVLTREAKKRGLTPAQKAKAISQASRPFKEQTPAQLTQTHKTAKEQAEQARAFADRAQQNMVDMRARIQRDGLTGQARTNAERYINGQADIKTQQLKSAHQQDKIWRQVEQEQKIRAREDKAKPAAQQFLDAKAKHAEQVKDIQAVIKAHKSKAAATLDETRAGEYRAQAAQAQGQLEALKAKTPTMREYKTTRADVDALMTATTGERTRTLHEIAGIKPTNHNQASQKLIKTAKGNTKRIATASEVLKNGPFSNEAIKAQKKTGIDSNLAKMREVMAPHKIEQDGLSITARFVWKGGKVTMEGTARYRGSDEIASIKFDPKGNIESITERGFTATGKRSNVTRRVSAPDDVQNQIHKAIEAERPTINRRLKLEATPHNFARIGKGNPRLATAIIERMKAASTKREAQSIKLDAWEVQQLFGRKIKGLANRRVEFNPKTRQFTSWEQLKNGDVGDLYYSRKIDDMFKTGSADFRVNNPWKDDR